MENVRMTIYEIPGYDGWYGASADGRIWTKRYRGRASKSRRQDWIEMKQFLSFHGYYCVNLYSGGNRRQRKVHQLVLETFVGPCPIGMQACHKNDCKHDNTLTNLYFGTPEQNMADKMANGRVPEGEAHYGAKFREDDIRLIRQRRASGEKLAEIANAFNTTIAHISNICNKRIWRGVA